MPIGMPPQGFADQMRQQGQMGPPPGGPPPSMGAMPPMGAPSPMGGEQDAPDQGDQQGVALGLGAFAQLLAPLVDLPGLRARRTAGADSWLERRA